MVDHVLVVKVHLLTIDRFGVELHFPVIGEEFGVAAGTSFGSLKS